MKYFQVKAFINHLLRMTGRHGVHSPYVYEFINDFLKDQREYYPFEKIEALRKQLLKDDTVVAVNDFGAGSNTNSGKERKVSEIAKVSAKSKKTAQIIFKLAVQNKAQNIIELGTNLGLTTAYLASANKNSKVWSIEGCPNIFSLAQKTWINWKSKMYS